MTSKPGQANSRPNAGSLRRAKKRSRLKSNARARLWKRRSPKNARSGRRNRKSACRSWRSRKPNLKKNVPLSSARCRITCKSSKAEWLAAQEKLQREWLESKERELKSTSDARFDEETPSRAGSSRRRNEARLLTQWAKKERQLNAQNQETLEGEKTVFRYGLCGALRKMLEEEKKQLHQDYSAKEKTLPQTRQHARERFSGQIAFEEGSGNGARRCRNALKKIWNASARRCAAT